MKRVGRSFKPGRTPDGDALIICDQCFKPDKWAKRVSSRRYLCLKCRRSNKLIMKN